MGRTQRHHTSPAPVGWLGRRPLLTVGVTALSATAAALFLPITVSCIGAAVLLLLGPLPPLRQRWGVLLTAAVFLLSAAGQRYVAEQPLEALAGQTATVTARVVETPQSGQMYTVQVTHSDRIPAGTRLSLYCAPGSEPLRYDTVTAYVTLKAVPASSAYRRSGRIFLYAFPEGEWDAAAEVADTSADPPRLYALGQYFDRILRRTLPGEEGALLSALCLGQRQAVAEATDDAFRNSGLPHLLVVSGLHLSMVAVALRGLLRRMGVGYRLSAAMTLPLIWMFAGMVGNTSSALRAAVMCSLWLLSFVVYRRYDGLNAWGLAAALLLAMDPYRLLNAGFQLSFAATAGVLIMAPRLYRPAEPQTPPETTAAYVWRDARRQIRNGCGVCVGALLFTLPLTVFYYNGLSLTALPANLLAVIPTGWALTVGWLGILCSAVPFLGWVGQPLLYIAGWLARYLDRVARLCGPDEAFVPTPYLWQKLLVAALCGIILCGILCRVPWRRILAAGAALTLCVTAVAVPLTVTSARLTVIACGGDGAVLVQQGRHAVLLTNHSGALTDVTYELERRGVTRLDGLFVDGGSPANGAALTRLWEAHGQPAVYTADESAWYSGLAMPVEVCNGERSHTLWQGCRLTLLSRGWWRLDLGGACALIGTDPDTPRPATATLTVFTTMPRALPDEGYCVVSCRRDTTPAVPLDGPTLLLTEQTVTLTTQRSGEWSVLPWL